MKFKAKRDQLISDFILIHGDIGKAAAFAEGVEMYQAHVTHKIKKLEQALEMLLRRRSERTEAQARRVLNKQEE